MMLEAINLNKFYGSRQALESVSFAIDAGEVVGFLGVNGAGKSTTMRILTGFITPTLGEAKIAGLPPSVPKAREKIGYLPEMNPLPPRMRVEEYLRFRAGIKGVPRADVTAAVVEAAERCGVDGYLRLLIGGLSKGMRQRVGLTDTLLAKPEILILDEPTAGLDPRQAAETRDLIAELGKETTVFLSSHILHDVERLCRRVVILDQGRIVADDSLQRICDKTVDERSVHVEIIADEPVRETLRTITGVRAVSVAPAEEKGGSTVVRLTIPAGVDLRREISLISARRGWIITEMRLEPVRLEDIFRRLTGGS